MGMGEDADVASGEDAAGVLAVFLSICGPNDGVCGLNENSAVKSKEHYCDIA